MRVAVPLLAILCSPVAPQWSGTDLLCGAKVGFPAVLNRFTGT